MKNKLKYVLCIVVSIAVTCSVVLFPYFYYYFEDNKGSKAYAAADLHFDKFDSNVSYESLQELLLSGEAIWVNDNNYTDAESKTYAVFKTYDSLNKMKPHFSDNKHVLNAFDAFLNDPETTVILCESVIASGVVNGSPVSAPMLYMEYEGSDYSLMSILIDSKNEIVYQYCIWMLDEVTNDSFDADASDMFDTESSDLFQFPVEVYEETNTDCISYLREYMNIPQYICPNITIEPNSFCYYLFDDYNLLRHNMVYYEGEHEKSIVE